MRKYASGKKQKSILSREKMLYVGLPLLKGLNTLTIVQI